MNYTAIHGTFLQERWPGRLVRRGRPCRNAVLVRQCKSPCSNLLTAHPLGVVGRMGFASSAALAISTTYNFHIGMLGSITAPGVPQSRSTDGFTPRQSSPQPTLRPIAVTHRSAIFQHFSSPDPKPAWSRKVGLP